MNDEKNPTRTKEQIEQEYAAKCQSYGHNCAVMNECVAANEELMASIKALRKEGQEWKAKTEGKTE